MQELYFFFDEMKFKKKKKGNRSWIQNTKQEKPQAEKVNVALAHMKQRHYLNMITY